MKIYSVLLGIFLSFTFNSINAQVQVLEEEIEVSFVDTVQDDTVPILERNMGIDDYKNETWKIFPNPALEKIVIKEPSEWLQANYTVINLQGKIVIRGVLTGEEISVNELENGLYIVQITNGKGKVLTKKLIKQ